MAAHTKEQPPDERSLLLPQAESAILRKDNDNGRIPGPARVSYSLYISHFLSTWNSRVFEFGAVLFLASIYPGTLLPMSIYALSRGLSAIIFAPAIGQYIDASNRLHVVRISIVLPRLAVAASCVIFLLLSVHIQMARVVDKSLLVVLAILACIEKLGSVMNLVAVERDWVVAIAGKDSGSLKRMNVQMRRIDLVCKLIGPLFIASIDSISTEKAILVNLVMNIASVVVEYFSIAKVYYEVPELQEPKMITGDPASNAEQQDQPRSTNIWRSFGSLTRDTMADFRSYARHHVFLPSFTGAILYLTVLSFSGQMVTWLLSRGYDSAQIAVARTFSVAFEMLATWVAPWVMGRIGVVRAGLWFASWQVSCLAAGMAIFWKVYNHPFISASGLVGGTILSRVGLRGFDLCVQIIVQEGVEAEARGSFSTTEAAWQNLFDMCSYICTIVFSKPDQFEWPALISTVAVGAAGLLYALYCRMERDN